MVTRVRSPKEREMPVKKLVTLSDPKAPGLSRHIRIVFPDGTMKYCSLNDFYFCIGRPHKADFQDDILGFKLAYKNGPERGIFNIQIFLVHASNNEIAWLRQRLDGVPEPIPMIEVDPKTAPIATSASCG